MTIPSRLVAVPALAALAIVLMPAVAAAHPLGNFTINHYDGIRLSPGHVLVDHVLDMAEIPTFSERKGMDANLDGAIDDAEATAYATQRCQELTADLVLVDAGQRVPLDVMARGITFPQGQGAPTLRLVCELSGALPVALTATASAFSFADESYHDRRGWREIAVHGDGATIGATNVPYETLSARLTTYPRDLLATPSDQQSASWTAVSGGAPLPAFNAPDATLIGGPVTDTPPVPAAAPAAASVPNGVTDLTADVTALFQARDLTPWIIVVSLIVAAGLGALHALSPGHGKTVMAAYLVGSRGNARQALGLGLMVTVSHTIGVLALGLLSLSFSAVISPDRLYPILGLVSGVIVVAIGGWLVWQRVGEMRRAHAVARETLHHADAHARGLDHDHLHTAQATERGSRRAHEHAAHDDHESLDHGGHERAPDDSARGDVIDDGWHSHGGMRHTHLPPKGTTLSRRGLITLGLAGGMVPSVSALIVLLGALAAGRPAYGIVLTVAFGAGMAIVLVGVGLALVYARGFVERFSSRGRGPSLVRWLPIASPFIVVAAGALMTVQALAMR